MFYIKPIAFLVKNVHYIQDCHQAAERSVLLKLNSHAAFVAGIGLDDFYELNNVLKSNKISDR